MKYICLALCSLALGLFAQNTNDYLGPNQPIPGNPQLVRIQILVYNDPKPKGVRIENVTFNGQKLSLKPRDIYGFRGQASFQQRPGKYKLRWEVNRDDQTWPRTIKHEEELFIDKRDMWIQVTIVGNEASIS